MMMMTIDFALPMTRLKVQLAHVLVKVLMTTQCDDCMVKTNYCVFSFFSNTPLMTTHGVDDTLCLTQDLLKTATCTCTCEDAYDQAW